MTHIVAIAGPSCAGKTELARHLARVLPAPMLPLDAYYRDLAFLPFAERVKFNFDVPDAIDHDLLRQHLSALLAGREIQRPVYDFTTHTRSSAVERLLPSPYLLLEGLFALYWEDIRPLLATKIYVEAPDAVCLARRQVRDVRERGRTPESVLKQYSETVRPMAELHVRPSRRFADVIVSGEVPLETSAAAVLAHVNSRASAAKNANV